MKKILSLLLVLILMFSLVACSNDEPEKTNEIPRIRFSQSVDELKQYDGQTVKINGFMSLLSPINGSLIYLMNIPFQACPYCLPNTTELSNTIAIKGEDIKFTSLPVEITGTLVFGNFSDSYGYEYTYRIENAKIKELDEKEISEKIKVYYTVAQDDTLGTIYMVIDCIAQVAYYEDVGINPEDFKEYGDIPFDNYADIKKTVEKLNTNGEYDAFLSLLNKTEETRNKVNADLQANNIEAYKSYTTVADELFEAFNEFVNQYEF